MNRKIEMSGRRYDLLLGRVATIIADARAKIIRDINLAQVASYWHIGKVIVEHEQGGVARAGYGDALILQLSRDMTGRFGRGFSQTNLKMMRLFYKSFPIRQTSSDEFRPRLSWSHYCELLKEDSSCIDVLKRYTL